MKPSLADFGLTEDDVQRYKAMMAVYAPKKQEQLREDKKFNESQTTKGICLMVLFIIVVSAIGLAEAMSYGFPTVACLLFCCPPIFVALCSIGKKTPQERIGCWSTLGMILLPGSWIPVLMEQRTPETVDDRLQRANDIEPELDRKMTAYIEAVNKYNWEHNLPLILPESKQWYQATS